MGPDIFLLKPSQTKRTNLDKAYNTHVKNLLPTLTDESRERWEIYSIIIEDLVSKGKTNYLKEIKYRLTDGEEPSNVILDIIERESENIDNLSWYMKRRIEEYVEEDYFKRFLL